MNYILDNCSLVNLANCGLLTRCVECLSHSFFITPVVYHKECTSCVGEVDNLIKEDKVYLLPFVPDLEKFASLVDECSIDDGECESILACVEYGYSLSTDDLAARKCAEKKLGQGKFTGSIGLIKQLVGIGEIHCDQAIEAFHAMKRAGAFLPKSDPRKLIC